MNRYLLGAAVSSIAFGLLFIIAGKHEINMARASHHHDQQKKHNESFSLAPLNVSINKNMTENVEFSKISQVAAAPRRGLAFASVETLFGFDPNWNKLVSTVGDVIVDLTRGNVKHALATILTTVLGPFGSLISKIFGLGSSSDALYHQILEKLSQIETKLDAIQTKLDKIVDEILVNEVRLEFRKVIKSVDYLRETFEKFSKYPAPYRTTFLQECAKQDMAQQLYWLHKEMTDSTDLSLVTVVLKMLDMNFFHRVSIQVVATATLASSLHIACIHTEAVVKGKGAPSKDDMVKLEVEGKDASAKLQDISTAISKGEQKIKEEFMIQVKKDTMEFMQRFPSEGHSDFADRLLNYLSQKYYWRFWFVGSYNMCYWWDQHAVATSGDRALFFKREYGRSLLVATSNNENYSPQRLSASGSGSLQAPISHAGPAELMTLPLGGVPLENMPQKVNEIPESDSEKVKACLKQHRFYTREPLAKLSGCKELMMELTRCVPTYSLVACVNYGNGLRANMTGGPEDGIIFQNIATLTGLEMPTISDKWFMLILDADDPTVWVPDTLFITNAHYSIIWVN